MGLPSLMQCHPMPITGENSHQMHSSHLLVSWGESTPVFESLGNMTLIGTNVVEIQIEHPFLNPLVEELIEDFLCKFRGIFPAFIVIGHFGNCFSGKAI